MAEARDDMAACVHIPMHSSSKIVLLLNSCTCNLTGRVELPLEVRRIVSMNWLEVTRK